MARLQGLEQELETVAVFFAGVDFSASRLPIHFLRISPYISRSCAYLPPLHSAFGSGIPDLHPAYPVAHSEFT